MGYRGLQGVKIGYNKLQEIMMINSHIPSDMGSPTWETHIPSDMCSLPGKLLFVFVGNWGNCALI